MRFQSAGASAVPVLLTSLVPAGFPSPALDYEEQPLDLHELLIRHPASTFFVRISGRSMVGAGIFDGDLAVIDRALTPVDGAVVLAAVEGDLTVKRLRRQEERLWLEPDTPDGGYPLIEAGPEREIIVWGVITFTIHAHQPQRSAGQEAERGRHVRSGGRK